MPSVNDEILQLPLGLLVNLNRSFNSVVGGGVCWCDVHIYYRSIKGWGRYSLLSFEDSLLSQEGL